MNKLKFRINQYLIYEKENGEYVYADFINSCVKDTTISTDYIKGSINQLPRQIRQAIAEMMVKKDVVSCFVDINGVISDIKNVEKSIDYSLMEKVEKYISNELFCDENFCNIINKMIYLSQTDLINTIAMHLSSNDECIFLSEHMLNEMNFTINAEAPIHVLPAERQIAFFDGKPLHELSFIEKERILIGDIKPLYKSTVDYYVYFDIRDTDIDDDTYSFLQTKNILDFPYDAFCNFISNNGIEIIEKDISAIGEKYMMIRNTIFIETSLSSQTKFYYLILAYCDFLISRTSTQDEVARNFEKQLIAYILCIKFSVDCPLFVLNTFISDIRKSTIRCFKMLDFIVSHLEILDEDNIPDEYEKPKGFNRKGGI